MDQLTHSLRLRSMTLRGIGSYLRGAELEIRPLTVLCGTNGSGKSTWINVLRSLARSCDDEGGLPFRLASPDGDAGQQLANAALWQEETIPERVRQLAADSVETERFGPMGTIGLRIQVLEDLLLQRPGFIAGAKGSFESRVQEFFCLGKCPAKSQIRLWLSVQDAWPERRIELRLDGETVFAFEKAVDEDFRMFLHGGVFGSAYDGCLHELAGIRVSDGPEWTVLPVTDSLPVAGLDVGSLCRRARELLSALLREVTAGVFYIGPLRDPGRHENPCGPQGGASRRYVGPCGEYTHSVLESYRRNRMRQASPPYSGFLDLSLPVSTVSSYCAYRPIWESLQIEGDSPVRRILSFANDEERRILEQARQDDETGQMDEVFCGLLSHLFERILPDRSLYREGLWPELPDEARELVDEGLEDLKDQDLMRLNFLLIRQAFLEYFKESLVFARSVYLVETYVGLWLQHLAQAVPSMHDIDADSSHAAQYWTGGDRLPTGLLVRESPHRENWQQFPAWRTGKFEHPCFPNEMALEAAPEMLSAGFHQILPVIVQFALMKSHEILCVENPEVHLHPGLQARFAGYFVNEARSGKYTILETHSDMFVQRILQAAYAGDLNPEEVRIFFTSLGQRTSDLPAHSRLESVRIGSDGRVQNWPDGFMDAEMDALERFLDSLREEEGDNDS